VGVDPAAANTPFRRKDHDVDTHQKLKLNEDNIAEFRARGGPIASFGNALTVELHPRPGVPHEFETYAPAIARLSVADRLRVLGSI
jgi:hypothetical protein